MTQRNRKTAFGLAFAVTATLSLSTREMGIAQAADASVEPGKVYVGADGLVLTVVPLKPTTDNTVLFQIVGSGSELDGKVIPHKVNVMGDRKIDFVTQWHGRAWTTIAVREPWKDLRSYLLSLPGRRDEPRVVLDDKRTAQLKSDDVFKLYQKQMGDGTLKRLATFDRKVETAEQDKQLAVLAAGVGKACGGNLTVKVAWPTFTDEDVKGLSIASYCGDPLSTMTQMCERSNEAKKTIAAKVKTFSCTMGKAMKLERNATGLDWTTSHDAANVGEFAKTTLEKIL